MAFDCVRVNGLTDHWLTGFAVTPEVLATAPCGIAVIIATQYESDHHQSQSCRCQGVYLQK